MTLAELDHGGLTFLSIQTMSELRTAALAVLCAFIYICMMRHPSWGLGSAGRWYGKFSSRYNLEPETSSHQHQSKCEHGCRLNGLCMFCLLLMARHSLGMLCASWGWGALGLSSWACQLSDKIVSDLLPPLPSKVRTLVHTCFLFMLSSSPALCFSFLKTVWTC